MSEIENSWVSFQLKKQQYGIPTRHILEMIPLRNQTVIPDVPEFVRGIINLRGKIVPLVDLRKRLGMESLIEETENLINVLNLRKQDHINWLCELFASVDEKREFKLTTDPHKCAFGKWYDTFECDNIYLKILLEKFDEPHKNIHAVAVKVGELLQANRRPQAIELIESTRDIQLSKMIGLFDQAVELLKEHTTEIVVVVDYMNMPFGFVVDSVSDVVEISDDMIEASPALNGGSNCFMQGLGKVGDSLKILLDLNQLLFSQDIAQLKEISAQVV